MSIRELTFRRTVGLACALTPLYAVLGALIALFIAGPTATWPQDVGMTMLGTLSGLIAAAVHRRIAWHRFYRWQDSCRVRHPYNFARPRPYKGVCTHEAVNRHLQSH